MRGKLLKVELKTCEVKKGENKGKKFKVLDFEVEVVLNEEKGEVRTLRGSMSEEYARKYFKYCGRSTREALGEEVEVITRKRKYEKGGEERTITEVKFLNLLDDEGKAIIMPKEGATELDF